jgi:hypothetical protein
VGRKLARRWLLASASLLAIVLGSGDANAVVFEGPGADQFIIPSTGWYDFKVAGAQGGGGGFGGGFGAIVGGELLLGAGEALEIIVGGAGENGFIEVNDGGGGGGGGSFIFGGPAGGLLFAAGGGGGSNFFGGVRAPEEVMAAVRAVRRATEAEAEPAFRSSSVTWACRRREDPFP